jgi:hypothetical protein
MPVTIKAERITAHPGVELDVLTVLREVLVNRPVGGTVGDFHKTLRLLDAIDAVGSGSIQDLEVQDSEAPILAQLLESQSWRWLTREWIQGWVEPTIKALRDSSKH